DMLTALCAALGFPPERGAGRCWDALRAHMQRSEANADYALVLLIDNGERLNQDMFDVVKAFWNWFPNPRSGDHARRMAHTIIAGDPALIRNLRAAKDKSLLSRVERHVKV
ncbi:MAG TPA: hypothetical protein VN442_07725, partial [Bryobacteraceae bacterium]|nr:hypothetical protein [Bryobacteraceae bacterium]